MSCFFPRNMPWSIYFLHWRLLSLVISDAIFLRGIHLFAYRVRAYTAGSSELLIKYICINEKGESLDFKTIAEWLDWIILPELFPSFENFFAPSQRVLLGRTGQIHIMWVSSRILDSLLFRHTYIHISRQTNNELPSWLCRALAWTSARKQDIFQLI